MEFGQSNYYCSKKKTACNKEGPIFLFFDDFPIIFKVGIYAGDDESYTAFPTVFNEVIKRYHNVDVTTNVATPEDYEPKSPPQLPPEGQKAIRSTRIRTARNLAGFRML